MSFSSWDDKLSMGIEVIDNDHKSLFDLFNQLHDVYASGGTTKELDPIFNVLLSYADNHFRREEKLMKDCDYPGIKEHCKLHRDLKAHVEDLYKRFNAGEEKIGEVSIFLELISFLKNWLHFHILEEDMKIRDLIKSQK